MSFNRGFNNHVLITYKQLEPLNVRKCSKLDDHQMRISFDLDIVSSLDQNTFFDKSSTEQEAGEVFRAHILEDLFDVL